MSLKKETIDNIIKIEGGYVNDSSDSGGKTKFGITIATARSYGYRGKMKNLTRSKAFNIYSTEYWDKMRLDDIERISYVIAEEIADTGVNMGVGRAGVFLQRALNVLNNRGSYYSDITVDGQIGNKTILALSLYFKKRGKKGEKVLYKILNSLQGAFYVTLSERRVKDEKFIFGWFDNRVGQYYI